MAANKDETYNGWANYPTWNVALWINNDQGWQETVHEMLREESVRRGEDAADEGRYLSGTLNAREAGEMLRDSVETVVHGDQRDANAGIAADLFGWALDQVDWDELGASFLADVAEADTYV